VRDYVNKHGFPGVVLGLSGGIDSALTLAIAVDALGADGAGGDDAVALHRRR
jgi:NAD+ synthase (glutamine-hydrolysing)